MALAAPSAIADFRAISGAQPDSTARWSASGGVTSFQFDSGLLESLGFSVHGQRRAPLSGMPGDFEYIIDNVSALELWAPAAAFDGFIAGQLQHSGPLRFEWRSGAIELSGFAFRPSAPDTLDLVDGSGQSVFRLTYGHPMLYPNEQRLTVWNMGVSISPWLAQRMGHPELAGMVIGAAFTEANLDIPHGADTEGACTSPNWHNGIDFVTDVQLTDLGAVQQVERQAGARVAIAPSATLENVGTADVPWYPKFFTTPPKTFDNYPDPYDRDQHPFLVWAMYRVVDDIPQQIAASAIKHAFATVNFQCTCAGGNVLWSAASSPNGQGCADVYDVTTNDHPNNLGVRDDLNAFTGEFEQCGSLYAPGATPPGPCNQTDFDLTDGDPFSLRLVVDESELQTENASYYFEAWYVVRDDVNIFNTMAHVSVTPTFGLAWTFNPGPTALGPAINEWVAPGARAANQSHTVESTANGHYSLAVKVTLLGGGAYRYVYALMNYDFDPRFDSFALPLPGDAVVSNMTFLDGDSDEGNDWIGDTGGGVLSFTAPEGVALEWGHMATFTFEANLPPASGDATLTAEEAPLILKASTLVLDQSVTVFSDGFESAP